ncbi:coiled-coil domain-containing protein 34 [Discoglossus pictus]
MSSSPACTPSVERRRSHSTPQVRDRDKTPHSKRDNLNSSGDSTYSLMSPIYHDSYQSEEEDPDMTSGTLTNGASGPDLPGKCNISKECSLEDLKLTPWEEWLLCKEKKGRMELQKKLAEELKQEEERLKQQQQIEMKKTLADQQHKEWVRRKNEQEKKEKEEKRLKEQQEKESQQLKNMTVQEKSKEKYNEWLQKKTEEEREKARKEKEQEEKRLAELREKREKANQVFEEWLEQAKNKPRPTLSSYGKLTGYYDGSSYPAPGFCNPIPWKPIPVPPPPKEADKNLPGKMKKRPTSSKLYRPSMGPQYKPRDNLHVGGGLFRR